MAGGFKPARQMLYTHMDTSSIIKNKKTFEILANSFSFWGTGLMETSFWLHAKVIQNSHWKVGQRMFWGIGFSPHRLDTTHDPSIDAIISMKSELRQVYQSVESRNPPMEFTVLSYGLILFSSFLSIATYGSQLWGNQLCEIIDVMLLKGNTLLLKVCHLCGLGST